MVYIVRKRYTFDWYVAAISFYIITLPYHYIHISYTLLIKPTKMSVLSRMERDSSVVLHIPLQNSVLSLVQNQLS